MSATQSYETLLHDRGPCLSILLPIDHSQSRTPSSRGRLRKILRSAARQATKQGLSTADQAALLEPWERALTEDGFWKAPGDGVALLSSPRGNTALWFDEPVREGLRLGSSFDVVPLLRLRNRRRTFAVLSLSAAGCRLTRWDGVRASEVDISGLPENLVEAVGTSLPRELQYHSTGRPRLRVVHAGGSGQDEKGDLRTYFQRVDAAVRRALTGHHDPVVLAGVEYLVASYREISHLPNLLAESLSGNLQRRSAEALCQLAKPLVERSDDRVLRAELQRFIELVGTGLAVTEPEVLAEAATTGGVETLFVADSGSVKMLSEELERVAIQVLRYGGGVRLVPAAAMPNGSSVAGILRRGRAS